MRLHSLSGAVVVLYMLVACSAIPPNSTPTPIPTLTPINALDCVQIDAHSADTLTCIQARGGVLLQTGEEQATLALEDANITLDGTLYLLRLPDNMMSIASFEGTGVIGAGGVTRVIQPGTQVELVLETGTLTISGTPSAVIPVDTRLIRTAPIHQLDRTVTIPEARGITEATIPSDDCAIPAGWTGFYTIVYGDTLTAIANRYDLTVMELQTGNCIINPNGLFPGDVLRVPPRESTTVEFRADEDTIPAETCTTLLWEVDEAQVVYLNGNAVPHASSQEVCPISTTTYTLLIVFENGEQNGYTQRVTVE